MKSSCSAWQPCSKGRLVASSTASMAASGAIKPRCFFAPESRAAAKRRRVLIGRAKLFIAVACLGRGLICDFAGESNGSCQQIALDQFVNDAKSNASCAEMGLPSAHISRAFATPARPRKPLRSCRAGDDAQASPPAGPLARRQPPRGNVPASANSSPPPNAVP